jgi:hypothetical protein
MEMLVKKGAGLVADAIGLGDSPPKIAASRRRKLSNTIRFGISVPPSNLKAEDLRGWTTES